MLRFPNIEHFEELRDKINVKLKELLHNHQVNEINANRQIYDFPWLYGALGKVPADVMFIAENPSLKGIEHAHLDTIDEELSDIEAQWWGGRKDKAATVFRPVLYDLGYKTTPPNQRLGWQCYITNVIKLADYANVQEKMSSYERKKQTVTWSEILKWEFERVKPILVFCLGENSYQAVKYLKKMRNIPEIRIFKVMHYSARGSQDVIRNKMKEQILDAIRGNRN